MLHFVYEKGESVGLGHIVRTSSILNYIGMQRRDFSVVDLKTHKQTIGSNCPIRDGDTVIYDTKTQVENLLPKINCKRIIIDPTELISEPCNGVLFPHMHATGAKHLNAVDATGSDEAVASGSDYTILFTRYQLNRGIVSFNKRRRNVVFAAGGADPDGMLEIMLEATKDIGDSICRKFLVGKLYNGPLQAETIKKQSDTRIISWNAEDMATARVAVTMMGVTVYEFLKMGVPVLIIPRNKADIYAIKELRMQFPYAVEFLMPLDCIDYCLLNPMIRHRVNSDIEDYMEQCASKISDDGAWNCSKFINSF